MAEGESPNGDDKPRHLPSVSDADLVREFETEILPSVTPEELVREFEILPSVTDVELVRDSKIESKHAISEEKQRENVREFLARGLVTLLAATLAVGFLLIAFQRLTGVPAADIRTFFELIFGPLVALVSAATGFYFGSTSGPKDKD